MLKNNADVLLSRSSNLSKPFPHEFFCFFPYDTVHSRCSFSFIIFFFSFNFNYFFLYKRNWNENIKYYKYDAGGELFFYFFSSLLPNNEAIINNYIHFSFADVYRETCARVFDESRISYNSVILNFVHKSYARAGFLSTGCFNSSYYRASIHSMLFDSIAALTFVSVWRGRSTRAGGITASVFVYKQGLSATESSRSDT